MANFDDTYHSYASYLQQYHCPECGQSGMEQHKPECWVGQQQMAGMQNSYPLYAREPDGTIHRITEAPAHLEHADHVDKQTRIENVLAKERLYARLKTGPWRSRLWSWLREVPLP